MKLSTKAALVSGFVLPGAGYFLVRAQWRGVIATAIGLTCLFVLTSEAAYRAKLIAEKILSGTLPFDAKVITHEIASLPGNYSADTLSTITTILLATWLFSIIDGYRIGRKHEGN